MDPQTTLTKIMMKFIVNNRTDTRKTDVHLLNDVKTKPVAFSSSNRNVLTVIFLQIKIENYVSSLTGLY